MRGLPRKTTTDNDEGRSLLAYADQATAIVILTIVVLLLRDVL